MKIIITEKQLEFLLEQQDYTSAPSDSTKTNGITQKTDSFLFDEEPRNCYDLLKFMDGKISEMLSDGKSKEQIAQIFASNVKIEDLSQERQNEIDPYNVLRSDIVKNLRNKQGNLPVQRLLTNCTNKFELDRNVIKNKSIFRDLKIKVVEIKRGSSDPQGSQCGRPNWGKASAACMRPLFTGPQYK